MLFYIDYLDHITSRAVSAKMLALRLRYDLLIFADDTMCMSVPSCVKLKETTDLLMDWMTFGVRERSACNWIRSTARILCGILPTEKKS